MTEKWLAEKDEQLIHIMVQKDRLEDKMRIRDDYKQWRKRNTHCSSLSLKISYKIVVILS